MKGLLLLFMLVALSQITFAQARFGIRGGLNIANQKMSADYLGDWISQSGDAIPSFHIGPMVELPLSEHFAIQSALLLSGKGSNLKIDDRTSTGNVAEATIRPFYLELPVVLVAKTTMPNSNLTVFGGAGPSLAYGLFGKVKSQGESYDVFEDHGLKRFDLGIDLTAGVEIASGFQFSFHFTPGLDNVAKSGSYAINLKNKVVGFSIGYFFGAKN